MNKRFRKHFIIAVLATVTLTCFLEACKKPTGKQLIYNIATTKDSATTHLDTLPSFNSPHGLAFDAAGNLYVADYGNNLIRKITPAGMVSTLSGAGTQGSVNSTALLSTFNGPSGLAVDASGYVYVADALNNLIRKVTPAGAVSTLAGADTTGYLNGTGTAASFWGPAGLVLDGTGNLYVADAGNNVIRMVTQAGVVTTYAGNNNPGIVNSTLAASSFYNPTGVTFDNKGNLIVADYLNNMIRKISTSGAVTTLAGNGDTGAANGADSTANFYFPNSVAADAAGNIYVADEANNLIRKINTNGTVTTLAGSGSQGAIDGTGIAASFNAPAGIALDASGNIYVADSNNNIIRKITPAGVVSTYAGSGLAGAVNGKAIVHRNTHFLKTPTRKLNLFYYKKGS